jgi:hypothetical protein
MALTDIWYGSEIKISIGKWETDTWVYEVIEYREGFNPDTPDDSEGVYDGLIYKGEKKIQVEDSITLSQKFKGWGLGLDAYNGLDGLVIKAEIVPNEGDAPTQAERYYTNFCARRPQLNEIPNQGEFMIELSGRFDDYQDTEPIGSEDWVIDHA